MGKKKSRVRELPLGKKIIKAMADASGYKVELFYLGKGYRVEVHVPGSRHPLTRHRWTRQEAEESVVETIAYHAEGVRLRKEHDRVVREAQIEASSLFRERHPDRTF